MATYEEIFELFSYTPLRNKIAVAAIVTASAIAQEDVGTPHHAERITWAKSVYSSPKAVSDDLMMAVLAANKNATVQQIQDAADATIQNNVDDAVNVLAGVTT